MKGYFTAISLSSVLTVAACVSEPLVSMDQAVAICTERTLKYEDTVYGPFMDYPDPLMVQDYYRSCVHAKAGANPPAKYQSTKSRVYTN